MASSASRAGSQRSGASGASARAAPGSLVAIQANPDTQLAFQTATADPNAASLPNELGGTQVYFNGIRSPRLRANRTLRSPDGRSMLVTFMVAGDFNAAQRNVERPLAAVAATARDD